MDTFNMKKIAAWSGIIAPVLFVLVFTIEGLLRTGYHPREIFISALSLGPRGWIQITNFMIFGVLLFVFSRGVASEFQSGKASRSGPVLLMILAICYFLSGPFVMDPTGTPVDQTSVHGTLHGIFGAIVFVLMPVTCFVFFRRFREDPEWQSIQWWTLVLGMMSALGVVLLTVSTKPTTLQGLFAGWEGVIQRAAIIPFMFWISIFAVEIREKNFEQ